MLGNKIKKKTRQSAPKTAVQAHVVGKKKEFAKKGETRRRNWGEDPTRKTEKNSKNIVKRQQKHIERQKGEEKEDRRALERKANSRRGGERGDLCSWGGGERR